jgi:hypothetical protein
MVDPVLGLQSDAISAVLERRVSLFDEMISMGDTVVKFKARGSHNRP